MHSIAELLKGKFVSKNNKKEILKIIEKITGINISESEIKTENNILIIKSHPIIKSKIVNNKTKILLAFKDFKIEIFDIF